MPNPVAPPVLTGVPGTDTLVLIRNPEADLKSGWHAGPRRAAMNLREFTGWQVILSESTDAADPAVQACSYRTPLVTDPANRVPVPKPEYYDPYHLKTLEVYSAVAPIPNGKYGWNRPQLLGLQTPFVEADWAEHQRIMDTHWDATPALLHFLQHDPTVPEKVREAWCEYGLAKDEFIDHGHRPYGMYVREARRITARAMFTQHDAMLAPGLSRAPFSFFSFSATLCTAVRSLTIARMSRPTIPHAEMNDTDSAAESAWLDRIRDLSPVERLEKGCGLSQRGRRFAMEAIHRRHPAASATEKDSPANGTSATIARLTSAS